MLFRPLPWPAISFFLLFALGNGAYWKWREGPAAARQAQLDDAIKLNQLEQDEITAYHSVVELSGKYIAAKEEYAEAPSSVLYLNFTLMKQELDLLRTRLTNLERAIAKLEGGAPRILSFDLPVPAPPGKLRIIQPNAPSPPKS